MKKIMPILFSLMFSVAFLTPALGQDFDVKLFEGPWAGKWISDKERHDNAPLMALIQVDRSTGTASIIMFQVPAPPAPSFSSLSIGKIENGKIVIDAASSGIDGGGSEMMFWLETPILLKGTFKNYYDSGTFEFRRSSGKSV